MKTWLLAWNVERWTWHEYEKAIEATRKGNEYAFKGWRCRSKQPKIGDRFYLIKLGQHPRGIIASGYIDSESYESEHWDKVKSEKGKTVNRVDINFDKILDYNYGNILTQERLNSLFEEQHWSPEGSGIEIREQYIPDLSSLWMKEFNIKIKKYYEFKKHLEMKWSKSTAEAYSSIINTISDELFNHDLIEVNIHMINNKDIICYLLDLYLSVDELKQKDIRGNKIYSNVINLYVEFFNSRTISNEYDNSTLKVFDKPQSKPKTIDVNIVKKIKRDSLVSGNAIERADYLCEYNNNHKYFISKTTQNNYVEAHHIIPISMQNNFKNSLDVEANVASLCLVCHKTLHHGLLKEKTDIIRKLYDDREERLEACNIGITYEDLLIYYK